ncbi:MAG: B-box zinc finger protein, partial [Chloroflexota bacterium]|nr:B-box zinc finger protein [Chloroflexota bacterium]
MTEELRCARHPGTPTSLRCSRCGTPVCARCMVYTPVGIRCPDCARQKRSGVYAPSASSLLRAVAMGAAVALVVGAVWGLYPIYG